MKAAKILMTVLAIVSLKSFADIPNKQDCEHSQHDWKKDTAEHAHGDRFEHSDFHHLDQQVNLTDAQKKTLEDARAKQEPANQALHEKIRSAHDALEKAVNDNADDATLNRLSADLAASIAQQELSHIKAKQEFLSVLTPEQKQKLKDLKPTHHEEHDHLPPLH